MMHCSSGAVRTRIRKFSGHSDEDAGTFRPASCRGVYGYDGGSDTDQRRYDNSAYAHNRADPPNGIIWRIFACGLLCYGGAYT